MKISNINICINEYLLHDININGWRINIQHFMLGCPVLHKREIDIYKQEILPTFRLTYGFYITHQLNWVNMEEISNIQY